MNKIAVKFDKTYKWAIYVDGKLVEGGFSSKAAAADYAATEYAQ